MKKIFDYLNNNAVATSLITLFFSSLIQFFFRKSDRKYNDLKEREKRKKTQFENKAELIIVNKVNNEHFYQCLKMIISDFKVKVSKDRKNVDFYYPKHILNHHKYKHLIFYMKNIGNADINELYICPTSQRNLMISDIDMIDIFVKNKYVNYNYLYDRKILKQDLIKVDIAYLEGSKICGTFCSELEVIFRDSYNNLYAQPFFIVQRNLYEPRVISEKELNSYISDETTIECFKNSKLW